MEFLTSHWLPHPGIPQMRSDAVSVTQFHLLIIMYHTAVIQVHVAPQYCWVLCGAEYQVLTNVSELQSSSQLIREKKNWTVLLRTVSGGPLFISIYQ